MISNLVNVGANIFAIMLMAQGRLSVGALGAVLVLIRTLMDSTSQLFGSIANFVSKKNEAAQFFELIDLDEQVARDYDSKKSRISIGYLEAYNISYRYLLTDSYRIKNLSF